MKYFSSIFFVLLLFFVSSCDEKKDFDKILRKNVEQRRAKILNTEVEKGIKCIDYSLHKREVTEKFLLLNHSSTQVDASKFKKNYLDFIKSILCEDIELKLMWENGVTFKFYHYGNDNKLICESLLTPQDCGF